MKAPRELSAELLEQLRGSDVWKPFETATHQWPGVYPEALNAPEPNSATTWNWMYPKRSGSLRHMSNSRLVGSNRGEDLIFVSTIRSHEQSLPSGALRGRHPSEATLAPFRSAMSIRNFEINRAGMRRRES
jgi:hypothetical protein